MEDLQDFEKIKHQLVPRAHAQGIARGRGPN
jgi:hypothetical protein